MQMGDRRKRCIRGRCDAERKVLLDATTELTELVEVVARAKRHEQIEGLWIVAATGH